MAKTDAKNQFIYQVIEKRLEQQIDSVKNLDVKASITLAVVGVLCSGSIQLVTLDGLSHFFRLLLLGSFISLVLAGLSGVLVFVQRRDGPQGLKDWRNDPDPAKLLAIADKYSEMQLRSFILVAMEQSYDHNRDLYRERYKFLYASWALAGVSVILLGIALYGGIT